MTQPNPHKKSTISVKRMALDAVLIAMFFALSLLQIPAGGLKFTFSALPIIICAVVFGPVDAFLVGLLGALLEQMMTYGFTPTTILWILPAGVRGLFIGLCLLPLKKRHPIDTLLRDKRIIVFYVICLCSAVIVSCFNTLTLYVDSKMYGYYTYALVFGSFVARIITGLISSALMATATIPVVGALRRAKIVS